MKQYLYKHFNHMMIKMLFVSYKGQKKFRLDCRIIDFHVEKNLLIARPLIIQRPICEYQSFYYIQYIMGE